MLGALPHALGRGSKSWKVRQVANTKGEEESGVLVSMWIRSFGFPPRTCCITVYDQIFYRSLFIIMYNDWYFHSRSLPVERDAFPIALTT